MNYISIENELADLCPNINLLCIRCKVKVSVGSEKLWSLIDSKCDELHSSIELDEIKTIQAIDSARKAYKACGKDPARYRLSAEALLRRVVSGKGLYKVNNVVDVLNLVSIETGFSIGGYDADTLVGDVKMGIGREDEPYEGLGRGELNIAGMPVFRDEKGAFGTSTSDSERTGVREHTTTFLMVIVSFDGTHKLEEAKDLAVSLLTNYASGTDFEIKLREIFE